MKFKCIIFDCDGVLVDSEATSTGVIVDIAKDHGVDLDLEYAINEFAGQSLSYCLGYIQERSKVPLPSNIISVFRERTFKAFQSDLKPIPGIRDLLSRLSCSVCVASNAPVNKIEFNLGLLNMLDYFNGNLFSAYQINKWKPEPDLFLYAAEKMGFLPEDCVVIEDSVTGVKAAKAGGFEVFGYASERSAKKLKEAGAVVFYDMNVLDELLKS